MLENHFMQKVLSVMERERGVIERSLRFEAEKEENQSDLEFVKNLSTVDLNLFPRHTMEELVLTARVLKTKYYPLIIEILEEQSKKGSEKS